MSFKVSTFSAVSAFGLALACMLAPQAHAQSCTAAAQHISRAGYTTFLNGRTSTNALLREYASSVYDTAALGAATFDGTNFSAAELGQLYSGADGGAGFQAAIGTSGVFGTFTLSNSNTDSALSGLISRSCTGADAVITVDATSMTDPAKVSAIDACIAKIDSLVNMPATMTITVAATEITGSIAGSGTVVISPGTLTSSANLSTLGSGVTLTLPAPYTVNGATLTLNAGQANGAQIAGTGTVAISSTTLAAGTYDFDAITTASTTMNATAGSDVSLLLTAAQSGTMTVAPSGGTYAAATITGSASADTVPEAGIDAVRTISGLGAADTLAGGGQADSINGGAGDDIIDGNGGTDTAVYSGALSSTTLTAGSSMTVANATDGSDTVSEVEVLDFSDADVRVIGTGGSSYATLEAFVTANPTNTDKLYGTLEITAATFGNGADALTSLNALLARMLSVSSISVNVIGMNANQLAALLDPNVGSNLPSITYPPVRVVASGAAQGYYNDIAGAVAGATAGQTVEISAGNYSLTSTLTINKNLTLTRQGSSGTVTISDTAAGGLAALVDVTGSSTVTLSNLVLTGGSGASTRAVVRFSSPSSGSVTNCTITGATGGSFSYGIFGMSGAVAVSGCTLAPAAGSNTNWSGIVLAGGGSVTDCTITGSASALSGRTQYGVSVAGGSLTVSGGSITGFAAAPSAAILSLAPTGQTVQITDATVTGNYYGVLAANGDATVSASGCNFAGTERIETATDSVFDSNYWGTTVANDIAVRAIGAVRFSPFRVASTGTETTEGAVVLTNKGRSYSTIQAALDAAPDLSATAMSVAAGNYNESPEIKHSGLTVTVATGAYSGETGTTPLTFTLQDPASSATLAGSGAANLTGDANSDSLTGNSAANVLAGENGADVLSGADGDDTLSGGAVNDVLDGGAGNDSLDGGSDVDTARFTGNLGGITGSTSLTVTSSDSVADGTDTVQNVEILDFADQDVVVVGRAGSEVLDLNTALANGAFAGKKFWGALTINSSTSFTTAAEFTAIYDRLLAAGSTINIDMSGMTQAQVNAVNASYATVGANVSNGPITISRVVSETLTAVGKAPTIQTGIDFAVDGDTITIAPGTYSANITVSKRVTLQGAGSGDTGATTITSVPSVASNVPVVDITVSGTVANRVTLKDLRLTGGYGNEANSASAVRVIIGTSTERSHYTFDNVTFIDNQGHGIVFNAGALSGVTDDVVVTNCRFIRNSTGFRSGSLGTISNVTVTGSTFTDNTVFGFALNTSSSGNTLFSGDNVTIENSVFNGNGSASFGQSGTGYGDLALLGFQGDATIRNVTINGRDEASAAHRGLQIRGQTPLAASGNIVIEGVTITGAYRVPGSAASLAGTHGLAMLIRNYSNAAGFSISNLAINNTTAGNGLVLEEVGGGLNLANTSFSAPSSASYAANDVAYSVVNLGAGEVNATSATFAGLDMATDAGRFAVQARLYDKIDATARGIVRVLANNVYVPSGGSVANGLAAAASGNTVNFDGVAYTGAPFTVNTSNLTLSALSGASGLSFTLGSTDAVSLAGAGVIDVTGNANANTVTGNDAINILAGAVGADTLSGGAGADVINGGDDADILSGGEGSDTVGGDAGDDALNGDAGMDTLNGGDGNDTLTGGADADSLNGGSGTDTAVFAAALSTITEIDSTNISAGGDTITGVEVLDFTDADVVVVGRGGSSVLTLNAALTAYPGDQMFWGELEINASTFETAEELAAIVARLVQGNSSVTVDATGMSADQRAAVAANASAINSASSLALSSADSAANIAILLGESTAANATVDMASMDAAQIAAVNGAIAKVASVSNYKVRVYQGESAVQYDLFVDDRTVSAASYPGAVSRANTLKAANPDNGYTVMVEAGTFALENVLTLGSVTLQGAGRSQQDSSVWLTKLTAPAGMTPPTLVNMITVTGNNATVRGLHLEGYIAGGVAVSRGIAVDSGASPVDGLTVDNVLASIQQFAFGITDGESATDVAITNSKFAASGNGVHVDTSGALNGLTMSGSVFTGNVVGFSSNADHTVSTAGQPAAANANTVGLTNVTVSNCQFNSNLQKGLYFEKLNSATFSSITVDGNAVTGMGAYDFGAGFELNLKYGSYSGITITNATISNNGTISGSNGIGLAIKARDDANGPVGAKYNDKPSSLSTVAVNGGTVSGSARNLVVANNVAMGTVSFGVASNSSLAVSGAGIGVQIFGTVPSGPLNLGAISVDSGASLYVQNASTCAVTATGASFGGANGATALLSDLYAIETKVFHAVDVAGAGVVTVKSGNIYVASTNSVSVGVGAASAGNTVNIEAGNYTGSNGGVVTVNTDNLTINGAAPGSGAHGYSFTLGTANTMTLAGTALINVDGNGSVNTVTGSDVANTLAGLAGADTLSGMGGADTLNGGDGDDSMNGGADNDAMNGDAGDDTMDGGTGADTMNGGADNDAMNGGADADTLNGDAGNDSLSGDTGDDALNGGDGDDSITGGDGADTVDGGAGIDTAVIAALSTSTIADGTSPYITAGGDSLTAVEILDFSDADVVVVGRGGSSFDTLDAALASSASAGKKFWGNLVITKDSFTDADSLNTLLGRFVTGNSSITVNGTGMDSDQRAAVAQYAGSIASASSLTLTNEDLAATITTLLDESTLANTVVEMAGMAPDQIAAVNAGLAKVASVNGSTVTIKQTVGETTTVVQYDLYLDTRSGFAGFPGAVERANAMKASAQSNSYSVEMAAGTFPMQNRIFPTAITLKGAGTGTLTGSTVSGGTILDMSAVAMASNQAGIQILGNGPALRDFSLVSPTRTSSVGHGFGIAGSGPQDDPNSVSRNAVISNVRVNAVARTAFDLNTLLDSSLSDISASNVAAGYGVAVSGGARNVAFTNLTISGAVWGDVGVYPYHPSGASNATAAETPSGISFGGELGFTSINCQPYNSVIAVSSGVSGDVGYNAAAQVLVPAAFNRIASSVRTNTNNGSTLAMSQVCRQKDLSTVLAGYTAIANFTFSTPSVTNSLGLFEVVGVSNGVRTALAGRSSLDAAIAAAANGNEVNVWGADSAPAGVTLPQSTPAVSLTTAIPANLAISITGNVPLTSSSFATDAILDSLVAKVASSATFSVALTSMNDGQINRVQFNKLAFDTITEQLWAINNAGTAAIVSALDLGGVDLTAYNLLPDAADFVYQTAVKSDMVSNDATEGVRAFASEAAAGTQWDKYVDFRTKAYAMLTGDALASADFSAGGRFVAVKDSRLALDGKTLSGETVTAEALATTIANFNGYAASGQAYLLASMNEARTSVTAVNAAASGINLDKARAADTIAAGITSSTSVEDIENAFQYQSDVAAYVTGGLTGGLITSVNAGTGANAMSMDQLNALAAGADNLSADSVIGDININSSMSSTNLAAFLPKVSTSANVTIDATDMSGAYLTALVANDSKVDSILNLTLTSAVSAADISTLLNKATDAIVVATGMAHSGSAGDQLNAVAGKLAKVAADGIRGTVNLSDSTDNLDSFLAKCSQLDSPNGSLVTVNASGMSDPKLSTLSSKITNIDSITSLTLTSAQSAAEIANLLTKSVDALAVVTGMAYSGDAGDQINAVAAGTAGIAADGIRGSVTVSSSLTSANLEAFLGKCSTLDAPADSTVAVDADTFSTPSKAVVSANIARVDSISNLDLDSSDVDIAGTPTNTVIANLLTKATGATAVATSMSTSQLNALGAGSSAIANDGISGTFTLTNAINYVGAILVKTQVDATVTVDALGMGQAKLDEVAANLSKVDVLINVQVSVSAALSLQELIDLLDASSDGTVLVDAASMDDDYLNAVAARAIKVAANGITGTMVVTSAILDDNLGALLAKASTDAIVEINASSMSPTELSAVAANILRVDEIYNLTLTSAQVVDASASPAVDEITALLSESVPSASTGKAMAVATATGMSGAQINALAGSAAKLANDGITGTLVLVNAVTEANMVTLLGGTPAKVADAADVEFDGSNMSTTQLGHAVTYAALVDTTYNLSLTNDLSAAQIDSLLERAIGTAATGKALALVDASGMDSAVGGDLAQLADNYLKIQLTPTKGITGTISITAGLSDVQITNLVSRIATVQSFTGGTTVVINASGMDDTQLSAVASAATTLGNDTLDITNVSLSANQSPAELAAILSATNNGQATINANGMDSVDLSALGTNAAALGTVTGTVNIDANVSAAAITALLNTSVSSGAIVNVDPTGFTGPQQTAYNTAVATQALLLVTAETVGSATETFVQAGQNVKILVSAKNLPVAGPSAVAAQARINYDDTFLTFSNVTGGADMPLTLPGTGDGATGSQRHVTFYTGIDYSNSASTGIRDGIVAEITFTASASGFCRLSDLVSLNTGFANQLVSGGSSPVAIAAIGTTSMDVSALRDLALAGVPTGTADASDSVDNISYYTDATSTTGAFVANPGVTASNNCGPEIVTFLITYPDTSTATIWPAEFPIGTSRVTWTSTDSANNTTSSSRDIVVINKHLLTVNVDFFGSLGTVGFNQAIRFRLSSGDTVTETVAFTGNNGAVRDIEIPVRSDYTCVSAKDALHTLADAQSMTTVGTKWVAGDTFSLRSGDSNDDNVVDIFDFAAFVTDRGLNKTPADRSNFNRDGEVSNGDFAFISLSFLAVGDNCNGANANGGTDRVTVKELRRRGLGHMEEADINQDGWVDAADIALAAQGQYRRPMEGLDQPVDLENPQW